MPHPDKVASFIDRWSKAEAAERANYVLFLSELCDEIGVPRSAWPCVNKGWPWSGMERSGRAFSPDSSGSAVATCVVTERELPRYARFRV